MISIENLKRKVHHRNKNSFFSLLDLCFFVCLRQSIRQMTDENNSDLSNETVPSIVSLDGDNSSFEQINSLPDDQTINFSKDSPPDNNQSVNENNEHSNPSQSDNEEQQTDHTNNNDNSFQEQFDQKSEEIKFVRDIFF